MPKGWELVDSYPSGKDVVKKHNKKIDLVMELYSVTKKDGSVEYIVVNKGTTATNFSDWTDNIDQRKGDSKDLEAALGQGKAWTAKYGDDLTIFVGHSKGGAEAIANAIKNDKNAIVFNPAELKQSGFDDNPYYSKNITAYVVKGEWLDKWFGQIEHDSYNVIYLPKQKGSIFKKHGMNAVLDALEEAGMK